MDNDYLAMAYRALFEELPNGTPRWQMAERIVGAFNVSLLGEEVAARCLFAVVNDPSVIYPDFETTRRIVGRAEGFLSELFPEWLRDEPHMAEIAFLEGQLFGEQLP